MKKNTCRLGPFLKMLKRGKINLKKWLLSGLMNIKKYLVNFIKKLVKVVRYPQYMIFTMEVLFFLKLIHNSTKLEFKWCCSVVGIIVAFVKLRYQKDLNYGGLKEQLIGTVDKRKILKTSIPKFLRNFHFYFLALSLIFLFCKFSSIGDTYINYLGFVIGLILFVLELIINYYAFSPFLLILMMLGMPAIVNSIGSDKTILNWSFLLLFFVTIIGGNFFEERLVKGLISKEIPVENLILRKISNNIWVVFLYFGIVLSESIVNSTYYYIFFTSQAHPIIADLQNFAAKALIFLLVFEVYLGTEKRITYFIFRFYYRENKLKISDSLVRVILDKKERWRVRRVTKKPKKLEIIGINTYLDKKHNVVYVKKNSDIHKKIDGLNKNEGKSILGEINSWTKWWIIIMIAIIPINYLLDYKVTIDNGIYKIVGKSDKAKVPNEIEVLGDAIVYNGKVEAFDTHTQSFEHGTISIRKIDLKEKKYKKYKDIEDKKNKKEDIIYIELTKNVGNKEWFVYKK